MKVLSTLGFLFLFFANLYLSSKINEAMIQRFRGGVRTTARTTVLRFAMFFLVFFQYWALTRLFPIYLILILLAASTLGMIVYSLLGAISGFTLEENQQKIGALSAIFNANQSPAVACFFLLLSLLSLSASALLSLFVFWKYPIGDPKAVVLIALFHFVLPQVFRIPLLLIVSWPTVTSEYLDDDLRNSFLAESFSNIIYQTIFLLFPLWLFKYEIHQFQWTLPPFWVLLSIPLFGFIIGGLVPFFLGLYRYRAQTRAMNQWQQDWLEELSVINTLPAGDARTNAFDEKLTELKEQIERRFTRNNLFAYYQKLREADGVDVDVPAIEVTDIQVSYDATVVQAAQNVFPEPAPGPGTPADSPVTVQNQALTRKPLPDPVKMARAYLTAKISKQPAATDFNPDIMSIVRENYGNLIHWDIRFGYLQDLLQLYEITAEGAKKDIGKFIDARLAAVKDFVGTRSQKKNILAGSVLSVSSTVIIWLFKHYEPAITALIAKLVG